MSSKKRAERRVPTSELLHLPRALSILLDIESKSLDECLVGVVLKHIRDTESLGEAYDKAVEDTLVQHADIGPEVLDHSVAIIHQQLKVVGPPIQVLCRLAEPLALHDSDGQPTRFLWVLLSNEQTHPLVDTAAEFSKLMDDEQYQSEATSATSPAELEKAYQRALYREVRFGSHIPDELRPTGSFCGGVKSDIRRRWPHFSSDFTDGLNTKALGSIIFLYFACLAPTVAFGALAATLTGDQIGPVEMIVATSVCGILYAIFAAQPLTILGGIAPVIILMQIICDLCQRLSVPFLPVAAWVGLWTMVFLLLLSVTEACTWIRFFTRFTDDTFAALISLIFIYEAFSAIYGFFADPKVAPGAAWMSLVLALGTYTVAITLSRFRRSPYLRHAVREFLADFGPTIAIFTMTAIAVAYSGDLDLPKFNVSVAGLVTTSGRPWLVNPFEAPVWVWITAAGPAVVVTVLLFLDQNITVRLVNSHENKLKKGAGYHLDLAVLGILTGICSLFGLPWMVAATVRSLNHVRSLATVEADNDGREHVVSVLENRVTALVVNLLMGLTVFLLPLVRQIPLSVLFGLFLFMGVASMGGNQFFERMRLWLMDPTRYPPTYYLRAVPARVVHKFTAIQALCLAILWIVKVSPIKLLFPVFIAFLVPVRMGMERFFKREHLALLDTEEEPTEEEDRYM